MVTLLITGTLIGLLIGILVEVFTATSLRRKRLISLLIYGALFGVLLAMYGSYIIFYLSGGDLRINFNKIDIANLPFGIFIGAIAIGFFVVFLFKMSQQRQ